ncbi:hypothetical protein ACFY93_33650 [Streptomyces sp. NPDC008313]|uniref:hypothetical protein n=1 Tax=Streptomyces sp. NPDC008313 TaxID=3364826 RepID=UPI0036E7FEF7
MYEMRTGATPTGTALVWHVIAQGTDSALCGQPLTPPDAGREATDRHCLPCMRAFQDAMAARSS